MQWATHRSKNQSRRLCWLTNRRISTSTPIWVICNSRLRKVRSIRNKTRQRGNKAVQKTHRTERNEPLHLMFQSQWCLSCQKRDLPLLRTFQQLSWQILPSTKTAKANKSAKSAAQFLCSPLRVRQTTEKTRTRKVTKTKEESQATSTSTHSLS